MTLDGDRDGAHGQALAPQARHQMLTDAAARTEDQVAPSRGGDGARVGRPRAFVAGPGSAAFEITRDLVYHLPVMVTPRWARSSSPPIALENLPEYLVRPPGISAAAIQRASDNVSLPL